MKRDIDSLKATGTGPGLSVCQQIVKFHEGSIDIASQPEQGTTVTIRLPKKRKNECWISFLICRQPGISRVIFL